MTLTHDPKLDDPALDRALKSEAFYIGALGSKRKPMQSDWSGYANCVSAMTTPPWRGSVGRWG